MRKNAPAELNGNNAQPKGRRPLATPSSGSVTVDARGHRCPVPTLRLRRALESMRAGEVVRLIADDPMARIDAPLFVREAGHELIATTEESGALVFLVRKGGAVEPGG